MGFSSSFVMPPQSLRVVCDLLQANPSMDPAVAARMARVDPAVVVKGWPASAWIAAVCFEMLRQETDQFKHVGKSPHEDRTRQLYLATRRLPDELLPAAHLTQKSECLLGFPSHSAGNDAQDGVRVGLLDSGGDLGLWLPWVLLDGFFSHDHAKKVQPDQAPAFFHAWGQIWTRAPDIALSGALPGLSMFTENTSAEADFWSHIDLLPVDAQPSLWCRLQLWQPGGDWEHSWWKEGFDNWVPKGPRQWPHALFDEVVDTMEGAFGPAIAANYRDVHDQSWALVQANHLQSKTPTSLLSRPGVRI